MEIIKELLEISKDKTIIQVKAMRKNLDSKTFGNLRKRHDQLKAYDEVIKILEKYGTKKEHIEKINKFISELKFYGDYYEGHYANEVIIILNSILEIM